MKKLLSIVLAAVMLLSLVPMSMISVSAETLTDEQGVEYTLSEDGTYYIVSGFDRSVTEVVLPSEYNGLPVTSIGNSVFNYCYDLTSVIIPDSVTSIGNSAFNECLGLTSIAIPDSITSISSSSFLNCINLQYNEYNNAKYLGNENNSYVALIEATDTEISSCDIHDDTKVIASYAFEYCVYLTDITIPDSVTNIGKRVFFRCFALESITVSSGNTVYHSSGNCLIETETETLVVGCENSVIPSDGSVTSIGDNAFEFCHGITSITIPDSITSIGEWAFSQCINLTGVTVPDSVTSIGEYAFYGCSGLTSITIPDSVTSIGGYAVAYCSNMTDIYCEAESQPEGWDTDWNHGYDATVHWGYNGLAIEEFDEVLNKVPNIVESDYAAEEWEAIQEAIASAKAFEAEGKTAAEIRAAIDALESAILLNPKKAEFGDLDGDAKIGASDYLFAKRACFSTFDLTDAQSARADINRDNKVDSADYVSIKRIAFGTYKVG